MENIFRKIAQNTTKFDAGDEEGWRELYEPLYAEVPNDVGVVKDQEYGPADRNQLDVYFPLQDQTEGKPVVFFVHGGGFFSGGKGWSEKVYLACYAVNLWDARLTIFYKCWANVGFYFAKRGFVTVLVNHRLVPNVKYPGGADDMQLAREWVFNNIAAVKYGLGSPNKVVLLGHSSGGAHIATNLYAAGMVFIRKD
ncbi:unnamed protein product [Penicillium pancosmium]